MNFLAALIVDLNHASLHEIGGVFVRQIEHHKIIFKNVGEFHQLHSTVVLSSKQFFPTQGTPSLNTGWQGPPDIAATLTTQRVIGVRSPDRT
jgi:hypothetical protein